MDLTYMVTYKQDCNWQMKHLHYHDSIELYFGRSTGGEFCIKDKIYSIKKNSLFILPAHTLHRTIWLSEETSFIRYLLHLTPETLDIISTSQTDFNQLLKHSGDCIYFSDKEGNKITKLFEQLHNFSGGNFGDDIRRNGLFLRLILEIFEASNQHAWDHGIQNPYYKKITPVLNYINEHFIEQITLEELASQFSFSKYYLSHLFKEGTGFSIMDYIIQRRILYAQTLLREHKSVQEAAEMAGFQTYSHFIRTFKSCTGQTPKQYEKRYALSKNTAVDFSH